MKPLAGAFFEGTGTCASPLGATITCQAPNYQENEQLVSSDYIRQKRRLTFTVRVTKEAAERLTSSFEVEGAEAGSAATLIPL